MYSPPEYERNYDPAQDLDRGLDVPNPEHYDFPAFDWKDAAVIVVGSILLIIESLLP